MNLCVFQGTFNPIHNAHLKMAQYAIDNFGFEKILFIPAYKPPHKDYDPDISSHRLKMVKAAVEKHPQFEVSDIEFYLGGKSYTYLTILELYKRLEIDGKISFIIGTDAFKKIETWYETDKLKELVDFIVFVRENEFKEEDFKYLKEKGYNFKFSPMNFYDISSTQLREKIKNNEPFSEYLPKETEEYINKYGLYRNQEMA